MTLEKALAKTRALLAAADQYDITVPKPTRAALQRHLDTAERLSSHAAGASRNRLADAILDVLADNGAPEADPEVIAAATALTLSTVDQRRLRDLLDQRVSDTLDEHRPAILGALAKYFEPVAANLVAAHERLGGINPKEPHAILSAGKQPNDWAEATRSLETINTLSRMWQNITGTKGTPWGPYIIGQITAEQWLDNEELRSADAWDLVHAGIPLRLLTSPRDLGALSREINRVREERMAASDKRRMQSAFPSWH